MKLITENYLLPFAIGVALSGGVRLIGDRFTGEAGLAAWQDAGNPACCLPLLNVSYAFGR